MSALTLPMPPDLAADYLWAAHLAERHEQDGNHQLAAKWRQLAEQWKAEADRQNSAARRERRLVSTNEAKPAAVGSGDCSATPLKGGWVIEIHGYQPLFGKVREIHDDGSMDVVAYDYAGELIGRVSPSEGGPKKFEPCVPILNFKAVDRPSFPLARDLYGTPLIQQNAKSTNRPEGSEA